MVQTTFFQFRPALLISGLVLILFFGPSLSLAEKGETLFVRPVKEGIHGKLAGSRIGELFRGTRVKKLEEDGNWVKVSLVGWMRKEKVVAAKRTGVGADGRVFDDVLIVSDFEIKVPDPGAKGQKTAFMLLTVENKLDRRVNGFRGVLIIKTGDKVVHREAISYELEPILPKSEGSVIFSWGEGERVYEILTAENTDKLQVKLGKVTLK